MRISREEIFGPVANVVRVADYEAALAMANDTESGCRRALPPHRSSVDYHVPFGGRKGSSYARGSKVAMRKSSTPW
ncbi:aldehyde dehydrogenase family domain-containing protein [Ditylenchus destructor]|nr:aldehyde dehydrogenase family domain-containing protein [Ditylenchus destructor]